MIRVLQSDAICQYRVNLHRTSPPKLQKSHFKLMISIPSRDTQYNRDVEILDHRLIFLLYIVFWIYLRVPAKQVSLIYILKDSSD